MTEIPHSASGKPARQVAREAALRAGEMLVDRFRTSISVSYKGRGNIVTDVDTEVEEGGARHPRARVSADGAAWRGVLRRARWRGLRLDRRPPRRHPQLRVQHTLFLNGDRSGPRRRGAGGRELRPGATRTYSRRSGAGEHSSTAGASRCRNGRSSPSASSAPT